MVGLKKELSLSFICVLLLLAMTFGVSGYGFCRQDLPNESNSCGLNTGTIAVQNYLQGGYVDGYIAGKIVFNYDKPVNAGNNSLWQVNYGFDNVTQASYLYNTTIPSECWNQSQTLLYLRMWSRYSGFNNLVQSGLQCYNGTDWETFGVVSDLHLVDNMGGYNPSGSNEAFVYDKVYSTSDSTSGSYFCIDNPTYQWMRNYNGGGNWNIVTSRASFLYEQSMFWDIVCPENWTSSYGLCRNGVHTKTYADSNNCGTTTNLPLDNGTVSSCVEPVQGGGGSSPQVVKVQEVNKSVSEPILVSQDALGGNVNSDTSGFTKLLSDIWHWLTGWL